MTISNADCTLNVGSSDRGIYAFGLYLKMLRLQVASLIKTFWL